MIAWLLLVTMTVPCYDLWPLQGWGFDEFLPGQYAELSTTFDGVPITLTPLLGYAGDPPCMEVRPVDQELHADVLTAAAVDITGPVLIDVDGAWRIRVYVGTDAPAPDTWPCLRCWGTAGDELGGDCAGNPMAPEGLIGKNSPYRPFAYLVGNGVDTCDPPHDIPQCRVQALDYCILDPGGQVFVGLIQVDDEPYQPRVGRKD